MDFRRRLVLGMAGRRRVDVYGIHLEPLRDLPGPLRGCHEARQLS